MSTFDTTSVTGRAITGALWTGTSGAPGDFALSAAPSSISVAAGANGSVVVTASGAFSGTIVLSVSGLPGGCAAIFSPASLSGAGDSTLTLYTSDGTPAGVYVITVSGDDSGLIRTTTFTLTVTSAALGSVRVFVDGLDRSNSLAYGSSTSWKVYRQNRATCQIAFIIKPGSTFAPQIGQFLEVYDQSIRVWAGTVDTVEITWIGDAGYHNAVVTGVGLEALFDGVSLDKIQYTSAVTPITCGAVVSDLFTRASIPRVTLGTISDGPDVVSLNVTNIKQALDTLASYAAFTWYVDPRDLKLYFHDAGDRAADWTLTDSPDTSAHGVLWETFDWKQTRQDFVDTQVSQLPGAAIQTQSESFAGDGSTTVWTLSSVPQFITSADVSPIGTGAQTPLGATVSWVPGTNKISVTPAMNVGYELVVKWLDPGQVTVANTAYGSTIGHRTRRYTRTRTFTADGATQEATAALAQYALLPAELQFQTDKPGLTIGRKLTINITAPAESSGVLNGDWQIVEVDGALVDGMDNLDEPYGHFRYTVYLVNFSATAIFQGDGSTTSFSVPTGTAVSATIKNAGSAPFSTALIGGVCNASPAPPDGSTVQVQYQAGVNPTTQPWQQTLEGLAAPQGLPGEPGPGAGSDTSGAVPASTQGTPQIYIRTLTLRDLTVGDDIASCPPAQHAGVGKRVLGVAKKVLTADLSVRFNLNGQDIITVTLAAHCALETAFEFPLITGSPAIAVPVNDKDIWTADILESDGQVVTNPQDMVAQFTVEWEYD